MVACAAAVVAARSYSERPYIATGQILVIATGVTTPGGSTQAVNLERAARLMAADLREVAQSRIVAGDVARYVNSRGLGPVSPADVSGSVDAAGSGSTVSLSVSATNQLRAIGISRRLLADLSSGRSRFVGVAEARRSIVTIIGPTDVSRQSSREILSTFGLRTLLGLLVAIGLALLWDYLDDTVHGPEDAERYLGAPVLARAR